jgi:hypothetical protein
MRQGLIVGRLDVHHDDNYGIDHRRGWTICWDGRVLEELMPLYRAVWRFLTISAPWRFRES